MNAFRITYHDGSFYDYPDEGWAYEFIGATLHIWKRHNWQVQIWYSPIEWRRVQRTTMN
jgi:hypothetical protein